MTTPMSWATYGPKLLRSQFFVSIPQPKSDFSGQTIIVTGSNTGLGLEAARQLVRLKAAKVILAVRTVSKGEAAAADILRTTKATKNTVEVWPLDLSNHDSIKDFGARVAGLDRLDAVIQNAGIMTPFNFVRVGDDEMHIAINTIAPILLALLILPKLRESAKKFGIRARLSFVGSDLHYIAQAKEANTPGPVLDALKDEKMAKENMGNRYALV
jgi:NAD(P)-dependent dehydrogenase (short-subunit alcohol dehydrogenase family)